MWRIASLVLVLGVLAGPALAAETFQTPSDVKRWLKHYYLKPDPERIPELVGYLSSSGMLDQKNAISPIFGFLSGVFHDNPTRVPGWVQTLDAIRERHLGVVVFGLWYSGLPDAKQQVEGIFSRHARLQKEFAFLRDNEPHQLAEIPLEQGQWILDALWGNFMATGSPEPVRRVISTLAWLDDKQDRKRYMVASSAKFSLATNLIQHRRVRQICKAELDTQSDAIAVPLKALLEPKKGKARSGSR